MKMLIKLGFLFKIKENTPLYYINCLTDVGIHFNNCIIHKNKFNMLRIQIFEAGEVVNKHWLIYSER